MTAARCPAYDDLIRFADTGERGPLAGHDPWACADCAKHLDEYGMMSAALRELKGLEDYDAAALRAAARPEAARPAATAPADDAARVLELAAAARERFHRDWPAARALADQAWHAARALPPPANRAERVRHDLAEAEAQSALGSCQTHTRQLEEGILNLTRAVGRWSALGEPVGLGGAQVNLAKALSVKGDLRMAESMARSAVHTLEGVREELPLAMAHHTLGIVLIDRKKFDEARTWIQRAIPVYRKLQRTGELAMAHQLEGCISLETGHPAEALAAASQAEEIFIRQGNTLFGAHCRWLLGRARLAGAGTPAQGLEDLAAARCVYETLGLWIEPALTRCDAGAALLKAGDRAGARRELAALQRLLPADQGNRWVSDAAQSLQSRLDDSDVPGLLKDFGLLTEALGRIAAPSADPAGTAH